VDYLVDVVVHSQDIRRRLRISRAVPEERLIASLARLEGYSLPFGAKKGVAGLGLEATDIDWRSGNGPAGYGPARQSW
jgi:hypothetical protein